MGPAYFTLRTPLSPPHRATERGTVRQIGVVKPQTHNVEVLDVKLGSRFWCVEKKKEKSRKRLFFFCQGWRQEMWLKMVCVVAPHRAFI